VDISDFALPQPKKRLKTWRDPTWRKPTHGELILRVGPEEARYVLPIPEAAWVARMLTSIFTGEETQLFRLGEKATFARYEKGRVQIELRPSDQGSVSLGKPQP
jgi:hypothetical protein